VYTLAVTKLQNVGKENSAPTLETLKEYLQAYAKDAEQEVKLVCLDDCSECFILVDGAKYAKVEGFFDESIERYRYDTFEGVVALSQEVYFNEDDVQEDVCFSFGINKKGVAEQMIVVYKEKVYDYTEYFEPTKIYKSLEELVDAKEQEFQEVLR
jgi:hypothetical protein